MTFVKDDRFLQITASSCNEFYSLIVAGKECLMMSGVQVDCLSDAEL